MHKECEEEGLKLFSEKARENARQILKAVYNKFPDYQYDIYAAEDQEIAIHCFYQKGKSLLILCDSNGGAAYFWTSERQNSRFRCDSIKDFPYDLLWQKLTEFDAKKNIL